MDVHIYFDHAVDDTPEIVMVIEDDVDVEYNGKIGEKEGSEKIHKGC